MYKLLAIYQTPPDIDAFERHYREVHLPLVRRIPGLQRIVLNRGMSPPWGGDPEFYMIAELHFANEAEFRVAMESAENRATGKDLRSFASSIVKLTVAIEHAG
jgi:uncharacterized protein (TIGR02118 family)